MGQARHTVFLVPMWKETLDFDMHAGALRNAGENARPTAFVGVANVGLDDNWSAIICRKRIYMASAAWHGIPILTLAADRRRMDPPDLRRRSEGGRDDRRRCSSAPGGRTKTTPARSGLQTLTDIIGNHYGVTVEASERNGWGQWHRADDKGVGMDRTVATGTGYIGQYRPAVAQHVRIARRPVPDDLLLFLHHVPYTYMLHSGKTVIQSIYDSHYEGAAELSKGSRSAGRALKGKIDDERFTQILHSSSIRRDRPGVARCRDQLVPACFRHPRTQDAWAIIRAALKPKR